MIDYVFIKTSNVANYEGVVNFSKSIDCIIIEKDKNSYRIYKQVVKYGRQRNTKN